MPFSHIPPGEDEDEKDRVRQSKQWYDASIWNIAKFLLKVWLANLLIALPLIVILSVMYYNYLHQYDWMLKGLPK
jgi:hypothetical protein